MSLQVWLPLNGSLENRGCSDVEITSSGNLTYSPGGKIGNCFDNSDRGKRYIKLKNALSMGIDGDKSICFWAKTISGIASSNDWGYIFTTNSSNAGNGLRATIANPNQYSIVDKTSPIYVTVPNRLEWNHIAIVSDSALCKVYVNGVYQASASRNLTAPTATTDVAISNNTTGSEVNWNMRGYINDFRLYDHCLSPKEVHEIAQGLVLHYPLNNIGGRDGNENLKPYTHWYSANRPGSVGGTFDRTSVEDPEAGNGKHIEIKCVSAGTGFYFGGIGKTTETIGKTYTWSFWGKCSVNKTGQVGDETGGYTQISLTTEWKKFSRTWTVGNSTYQAFTFYLGWNVGDVLYIRDFKFEEGSVATPWCPNVADPEYAALGYNSNVVSDCSGYGNDGTIYGTLSLDSNSSVYDNCTRFNGSSYIQSITNGLIPDSTNFSISCWIKSTAALGNWYRIGGLGEHTYIQLDIDTTGKPRVFIAQNGSTAVLNTAMGDTNILDGNWHHICGLGTPTLLTIYVDGVQKASSSRTIIQSKTNAIAYVGTVKNGALLPGSISDFRIYSTALSAEDVKALYQQGASIDNLGSMHTYGEFNEGQEKISIGKNKVVSEGSVNEASFYENVYLPSSHDENSISTFTPTTATNSCGCTLGIFHFDDMDLYTLEFDINFTGFETCGSTFRINWRGQHNKGDGAGTIWGSQMLSTISNAYNLKNLAIAGGTTHCKIQIQPTEALLLEKSTKIDIRSDYSNGTGKIIISNRKFYKTKYNNDNKTSFLNDSTLVTKEINEE